MAINNDVDDDERTPLVNGKGPKATTSQLIPQAHTPRSILLLITSIIFVVMFGDWLLTVPSVRIYEDIICHHYYDDLQDQRHVSLNGKIDEKECKLDPIQSELAIIMAGIHVSRAVPGILFAFPYGMLADRYGRKVVLTLAVTGIVLTQCWTTVVCWFWQAFPLRLIWVSPIFMAIGGGETVAQSILFAMISDVSTDATRANSFFVAIVGSLVAEVTAPSIASKLMRITPWIPVLSGIAIVILGCLLVVFLPETLHLRAHGGSVEVVTPDSTSEDEEANGSSNEPHDKDLLTSLKAQLRTHLRNLYDATEIFHSSQLLVLIFTFILQPLNRQLVDLSLRYISKRFDWSLAEAGFLLSFRAGVNVFLFVVILPGLSYLLISKRDPEPNSSTTTTTTTTTPDTTGSGSNTKPPTPGFFKNKIKVRGLGLTNRTKDLTLARLSFLCLTIGSLLIAFPNIQIVISGLMINVLGTGFATLVRSLITLLVDQKHVARVYAAIAAIEQVGAMVAGPLLAWTYNAGLRWKGYWVGLPFFGMALLDVLAGGGIWAVRLPTEGEGEGEHEEHDGRIREIEEQAEARDEVETPLLGTVG